MIIPDIKGLSPACIGQIVTVNVEYPDDKRPTDDHQWVGLLLHYTITSDTIEFYFKGREAFKMLHSPGVRIDLTVTIFHHPPAFTPADL